MQGESHPNIDVYAQTKHNSGRWINVTTFAFPTGDRSLGSVIVHLFRDVTQTKTHERLIDELVEASERLQDTNKQMRPSISPIEPALYPDHSELTPRERQILHLLAHGLSTGTMANTLSISPSTVRNHIQSILGKLDVHSRLEAVAYAYQHDLIAG
jgi:DNA-binding NarL/FixJ family response regulator